MSKALNEWERREKKLKDKRKADQARANYIASMTPEERAKYERRREINRANGARGHAAHRKQVAVNWIKRILGED